MLATAVVCDMVRYMQMDTAGPVVGIAICRSRRLLACALPALVVPLLGSLVYFVLLGPTRLASTAYVATKVFTIAWPVVAVWVIERRPGALGVAPVGQYVRALPLGLLTGLLIGGAILLAYRVPMLHAYALGFSSAIRDRLTVFSVETRAGYLILCGFLAILHSLIEEYYWRWYVFGSLARVWPFGVSVIVASIGFAAHHYVVLGCYFGIAGAAVFGTAVGVGGALWCWMMRRQETIAGVWLSHALVDAAIFIVGYDILFGVGN